MPAPGCAHDRDAADVHGERRGNVNGLLGIVLVGVLALALWWWLQDRQARGPEARLRRICMGDLGQVERMIDAEMTRAPGISRAEAAGRAVMRYERDNR